MDSDAPPSQPPPPPLLQAAPAPTTAASSQPSSLRRFVAVLLSLCLLLFLANGFVSLVDDSLILFFHVHLLGGLRDFVGFFTVILSLLIYALMGLTPMIPKRFFVPVTLFNPLAGLVLLPFLIYFYSRAQWASLGISLLQVALGLIFVRCLRRVRKENTAPLSSASSSLASAQAPAQLPQGPLRLISVNHLNPRSFSWLNLSAFLLMNAFVLLPVLLAYLFFCGSLAIGHLSEGFIRLHPGGFTVEVRKYTSDDGKTIQLVPMAHVGDPEFYRGLTQSFPSNSVILMEGVTDDNNLLTNKVSYRRMANSLGLSEQQKEFKPLAGEWVAADVDVKEFAPTTIDFLNMAMLVHKYGFNSGTLLPLLQYSPPANVQEQLWEDLLHKRNRHLLGKLHERLSATDYVIIPWGAAHMPEISHEIQNSGFHLSETQRFQAIRFGPRRNP